MSYLGKNKGILLGQLEKSEVSLHYYDTIENALTWHQKMLDVALAQSMRRIAIFADVTARLIETLRSGHIVLVQVMVEALPRRSTLLLSWLAALSANDHPMQFSLLLLIHRY